MRLNAAMRISFRLRAALTAVVALCALSVVGAQSPADGAWIFTMSSPMGTVEAKVDMKADSEALTGAFDMGGGHTWPIENGTIKGEDIAFTLNRPGGMAYEMKGTVKGDAVAGTAHAMGATVDWSMARAK
jgi:hypothetical protein